jgi:hypothetical protein
MCVGESGSSLRSRHTGSWTALADERHLRFASPYAIP